MLKLRQKNTQKLSFLLNPHVQKLLVFSLQSSWVNTFLSHQEDQQNFDDLKAVQPYCYVLYI